MRAVALSDETVQQKIAAAFIPLKIEIPKGTKTFPLDWPALRTWRRTYGLMGGEKTEGITACSVVSPDLETEYGSTGSAFVWEFFTSIAYDADRFAAMLDRAAMRAEEERIIRADPNREAQALARRLKAFRREVKAAVAKEGRFRFPPKGFTVEGAKELFRLTGDLVEADPEPEESGEEEEKTDRPPRRRGKSPGR